MTKCGPPGFESMTKSESFANNINGLHAFAEAESNAVLKKVLKSKLYTRADNIKERDMIYYKKDREKYWQGPIKAIAVNGK